jgi:hypothetical protein
MAIDGVKIIDSDIAHDVYNEFTDLYDSGIEIEDIKKKIEQWRNELDDIEFEIFITTYALALWEVDSLSESILSEVKQSIEKQTTVEMWKAEGYQKNAVLRQKELNKFIIKVTNPNEKPRKRKKYKTLTNFLFQIDDVLTFKATDGLYYASILIKIDQCRGHCNYWLTPTGYIKNEKPTIKDIKEGIILGRKIGNMLDKERIKLEQPGIEQFWKIDKKFKMNFTIGCVITGIEHKDLIKFYDKFEVIGKVVIKDGFKEIGSIGYEDNFEDYSSRFLNFENQVKIFDYEKIPLKMITEE